MSGVGAGTAGEPADPVRAGGAADPVRAGDTAEPARAGDRLLSNAGALMAGRLAVAIMGWVGSVLITRTLTPTQFGQFALVFSVLGMLSIVTEMGIGRVAISGVLDPTRDRATFAGTYVLLRSALGLLGYVLAVGFVLVLDYPPVVVHTMLVAGLVVLLATPSHAYNVAFQSMLRMPRVAIAEVLGQSAQLALTVAVALRWGTVTWFAVPAVLCEIVIFSMKRTMAHRLMAFRYRIDTKVWWALLREAVPISVGTALSTVYYRLDSVMLSRLDTYRSVGLYNVAYKFVDLAHFGSSALTIPVLTLLVRAWPDDDAGFRNAVRRGVSILAVIATLVVAEITVFSTEALGLLYPKYVAADGATRLLVLAECIAYFGNFAFAILLATGRHRGYPLVTGAGLLLNIVLNLALIPRYSYHAAALNTLITEVLVTALLWFMVRRLPNLRRLGIARLCALPLVIVAGAAAGYAVKHVAPWPIATAVTAATVLALCEVLHVAGPGRLVQALGVGHHESGPA